MVTFFESINNLGRQNYSADRTQIFIALRNENINVKTWTRKEYRYAKLALPKWGESLLK